MHVFIGCRLLVGPVDVAADTLRVCPMASGFGFADLVTIIIIIIPVMGRAYSGP